MLKKPSTSLGRILFLLAIAYGGFTAIALIALLGMKAEEPLHAIAWHARHGNTVTYDGHLFHLPALWYPQPGSRPAELTLVRARFSSLGLNHIDLRMAPVRMDRTAATDSMARMADQFNRLSNSPDDWKAETLHGRSLEFHCIMSSTQGIAETLECQAADSNLAMSIMAFGSARTEALNILETSE